MIFHLDLDSFFVSVERLLNPALVGVPMAVGGRGPRSVLSSASYEARKYGIRSAMPTAQALRNFPNLVIVPPQFKYYSQYSRQVFAIIDRFTPIVEKTSIDEAYLDMSGTESLWGKPIEAAELIRKTIREETQLAASIGIATNRRLAKIASDAAKPDGVKFVAPGSEKEFVAPLEMRKIPGIGPSTEKLLATYGIFRVSDLHAFTEAQLKARFENLGEWLYRVGQGQGSKEFFEEAKVHSISREETFSTDVRDRAQLKKILWEMAADLGNQLRTDEDEAHSFATTIRLKLRYPNFETLTRSRVLAKPTQLDREIYEAALPLLDEAWDSKKGVRLIGIGVVTGAGAYQQGLFEAGNSQREEKVDRMKDDLRKRFGKKALLTGRDLG